ncbi:glycerophosphodiester phosphodiesterase [Hydrogenimonas sp.]
MRFIDLFKKPNLIAAHRGDRSHFPENTLASLRGAIGKCDFVEMDIWLTKDGVPVILHDETLGRTSDVETFEIFRDRAPWRVEDFTLEELRRLDAGNWFYEKDPFGLIRDGKVVVPPKEDRTQKIPTLEEVLRFSKRHGIFLNLEIKDMHRYISDEEALKAVFDVIEKTETASMLLLSSFRGNYLPLCKRTNPKIPTALLRSDPLRNPLDLLKDTYVDCYHPSKEIVDADSVRKVRNAGYFVDVFVVNDSEERKKLFDWGVNAIFTDFLPDFRDGFQKNSEIVI